VNKLRSALEKVDSVDAGRLQAYLDDLRSLPPSMETLRAAHEVNQLLEAAVRCQRR